MPRRFYIPIQDFLRTPKPSFRRRWKRYILPGIAAIAVIVAVLWYALDIRFVSAVKSDKNPIREQRSSLSTEHVSIRDTSSDALKDSASSETHNFIGIGSDGRHDPIRIQVLNGCGVKGLTKLISPALRAKGFDVRETRNAGSFRYARSQIFDRTGRLENAWAVAESLGIEKTLVTTQIARNLSDIDVTLIVGADFEQLQLNVKR